jgi:hypothetical protein
VTNTTTRRRLARRRRPTLLRVLEQLSDDQVLLCSCDERHLACAG